MATEVVRARSLWRLRRGACEIEARLRPAPSGVELVVLADGRPWQARTYPEHEVASLFDAAAAQRESFLGQGWESADH